jgi:two-component system sensor histidine kinase VicK
MTGLENEFTPMLIEKDQSLKVNCVDVTVNIDRLRVMQVLINLLSNASKFSPEGAVITVDVVEAGDGVRFSVSDTGVGIREEDMGKLFVPFPGILVDGIVKGTGLGLSICKGIIELHGGSIWAESSGLGKGSVFSFTILNKN